MLKVKRVLAAKVEGTIGTAETLTATEGAFNAYDVMAQGNVTVEERQAQATFGTLSGVPGQYDGTLTFKTDMGWDGTTTMPSWSDVLFPACGIVESSQVYTPRSEAPGTNVKTVTIAAYIDGVKKFLVGAAGNVKIVMPTGRMAYCDFTFRGVWQAVADATILAPTYPTAVPLNVSSATVTYNSVNQCTETITLDAGNQLEMLFCPSGTGGFKNAIIANRRPTITMNPEGALVATDPRYTKWLAGTEQAFSVALDGPSTSTITIAAPKAQVMNLQEGERSGLVIDEVTLACNKNGATLDQDYSITFAETV